MTKTTNKIERLVAAGIARHNEQRKLLPETLNRVWKAAINGEVTDADLTEAIKNASNGLSNPPRHSSVEFDIRRKIMAEEREAK